MMSTPCCRIRLTSLALGATVLWVGCSPGHISGGDGPRPGDGQSVDWIPRSDGLPTADHGPASDQGGGQTCAELAQLNGWKAHHCESGSAGPMCQGQGPATVDCEHCCRGPSCAERAANQGWTGHTCDNGDGSCGGSGDATWDCTRCCPKGGGFGYPLGDRSTSPAGGWQMWQIMSHYWSAYGGRHLAQDLGGPPDGSTGAGKPVYSIGDGTVRYAKPNSSSYANVILIEHPVPDGSVVCSFYGHVTTPEVAAGQQVSQGQQIAKLLDLGTNSHLHYALLNETLCNKVAATGASSGPSGVCGYDNGGPTSLGRTDLANEPYTYTAVNDDCGAHTVPNGFISPSQFIDKHHF